MNNKLLKFRRTKSFRTYSWYSFEECGWILD